MFARPRVIPTLLIDDGNLVKTKKFKNPNYLGDPINAIKIFNEKFVDELCILDISASRNGKAPDFQLLEKMASEAFMPLSYGGGISNFDEVKKIMSTGFEKVVLNTAIIRNSDLMKQVSDYFGCQSVVASIDYKRGYFGEKCFIMDGTIKTEYSPISLAKRVEELGAGEILLYSIDNDGMRCGYDIKTVKKVTEAVSIPVIACGGAGGLNDIKIVLEEAKAHAVAAGSMFVYFGERQAVLINYPSEAEFIQHEIYEEN